MYYERLKDIYRENRLEYSFPEVSLKEFDLFIRNQIRLNNKYVNPYKFSFDQNIPVNETIKFFIYFTGEKGLLNIITYFECSNPSCVDTRIYIDIKDPDDIISCDECGKRYKLNTVQRYIKVLFMLKNYIDIPKQINRIERIDPNSTYDVLRELPPSLKIGSPSSLDEINDFIDEGDEISMTVDLPLLFNGNNNQGNPISEVIERFQKNLLALEDE